jgi:hypothetical protein
MIRRESYSGGSSLSGGGMATLVVNATLNRIDAMATVALAVHSRVVSPGTAQAHVLLPRGERAYVEIPKFGDPPPLAIDVISDFSVEEARIAALELQIALGNSTPWEIRPTF